MAFCTECGFKLPDDAVFCPNCGASMTASEKKASAAPSEIAVEQPKELDYSAPVNENFQNEIKNESPSFQTSGVYVAPSQGNVQPPFQGTYMPPTSGAYAPPPPAPTYQGGYAPQPQNPYQAPNAYGYAPYQGGVGVNTMPPKKSKGGLIAIIAVSAVVVIAIALILILKPFGGSPYVGYWESVSADIGDGISEDYYGDNIVGAISMQINSDGSTYLASAYDTDVVEGTWETTDDGIVITTEDSTHNFTYENKQLILDEDGELVYFEKADGDINNPSVPHGAFVGTDTTGLDVEGADTTNTQIAGSGYVENSEAYISVTGAEDIIDVDGDPAIRIYYEFTNNFYDHYSMSAWDVVSYYATQDGSDLYETYYDSTTVNNSMYNIRPGVTIQCWVEFKCNPGGGNIDFAIYGYDSGESGGVVYATYDPNNLPGAPLPYVIVPVTDPQWTTQLAQEGDLDGSYIVVQDAESVTDANGNSAVRVYYQFTNNCSYDTSFYDETYAYAYQDGISLQTTYVTIDSNTDMDYYTVIAPGQTITVSCVYMLRNLTSPIEAEVESYSGYSAVGATYYF